jgi:capsular exopolysaccharide synthesis family protein
MQLNEAANQALARRIDAEGRWNAINHGALLSSTEVVSNPAITGLLTQKAQLEGDLQQERSRHLDNYPTVIAKQQQLAALNQQLQNAAANIRNSLKSNYDAAVRTEKELLDKVDGLKSATLSEQDRSVKFGMLSREVDTNRQVYDGLLQRFKELNASAGISISNVSIVDVAARPLKPSSPDVVKNLLIAVVVSLALAAITVFIKDQFDDSIRIPENVEDKLGIALLGVVPQVQDLVADAMIDPKSPVAEAYNSIRSSLMYSTRDGLPKVILFTSAQPSEGKSTSSIAISRGLARLGKRTLLVDADMRRPSLHRQFDSENAVGLSSLLVSDMPLQQAVVSGDEPDLFVITSGPVPPSPTELLSSGRFEHLLIEAARDYDVVIIDSPPVLGLADAPLMAALVDGVVFIVEADRSRHGSLKVALRRLRSMRPVLLGAVLTKFDPLKGGNRYSAYYGYEYYQYEYVDGKE